MQEEEVHIPEIIKEIMRIQDSMTLEYRIEKALENKEFWSSNLLQLASIIGDKYALIFAEAFGGIAVYIPKYPRETSPIYRILPLAIFEKLCTSEFGGDCFLCPSAEMNALEKHIVRELLYKQYSYRKIALAMGVTTRQVRYIARGARKLKHRSSEFPNL